MSRDIGSLAGAVGIHHVMTSPATFGGRSRGNHLIPWLGQPLGTGGCKAGIARFTGALTQVPMPLSASAGRPAPTPPHPSLSARREGMCDTVTRSGPVTRAGANPEGGILVAVGRTPGAQPCSVPSTWPWSLARHCARPSSGWLTRTTPTSSPTPCPAAPETPDGPHSDQGLRECRCGVPAWWRKQGTGPRASRSVGMCCSRNRTRGPGSRRTAYLPGVARTLTAGRRW